MERLCIIAAAIISVCSRIIQLIIGIAATAEGSSRSQLALRKGTCSQVSSNFYLTERRPFWCGAVGIGQRAPFKPLAYQLL